MVKDIVEKVFRATMAFSLMMLVGFNGFAQEPGMQPDQEQQEVRTDFSEEEIEQFVEATEKVMPIEMAAQEKMTEIVEEEGLTVERYNEIATMQQLGMEGQISEEEEEAFEAATARVTEIQAEAEAEIRETLNDEGLSLEEFQEIISAYHQDPELRQRVDEKMDM
ncbi:DUF4168 domain-containing protein [Cytophagaceae bacterium ABcell3]|nr:DUF4168 domain-containing protein [Cytophagaceae bacterium ABcell3]